MNKTQYGIQMYSVRDAAEKDLKSALKAVADMGYKYIEFAGFFGNSAEDVRSWLDEYGLECSGSHIGLAVLAPDRIDDTADYHRTIGCDNLIVPACDWSDKEKFENVVSSLIFAQKELAVKGLRLGYHNHSGEFFPTSDGIVFEDEIINRTDIELEIDIFWLHNAGLDVVPYLEAHKDRIKVIHLKDGIAVSEANRNYANAHVGAMGRYLGCGDAPVEETLRWAIDNGVLVVVESEDLNPSGIEEVRECMNYLKRFEA